MRALRVELQSGIRPIDTWDVFNRPLTEARCWNPAALSPNTKHRPSYRDGHEFADDLVELGQRPIVATVANDPPRQDDLCIPERLWEGVLSCGEPAVASPAE
jgi:hypothetical protein